MECSQVLLWTYIIWSKVQGILEEARSWLYACDDWGEMDGRTEGDRRGSKDPLSDRFSKLKSLQCQNVFSVCFSTVLRLQRTRPPFRDHGSLLSCASVASHTLLVLKSGSFLILPITVRFRFEFTPILTTSDLITVD